MWKEREMKKCQRSDTHKVKDTMRTGRPRLGGEDNVKRNLERLEGKW